MKIFTEAPAHPAKVRRSTNPHDHQPSRQFPGVTEGAREFRSDIEGLRGVAVLLVVAFHAQLPGESGGYIGVDVFFVISGFLITGILTAELTRTGKLDLLNFYARRARRLLPAAALIAICTLIGTYLFLSPLEYRETAKSAFMASLFASNIWFMSKGTDYFADDVSNDPLLHTWSLAVEEQFYLVWPAFLLLIYRWKPKRLRPAGAIAILSLVSFILCIVVTGTQQQWAFYGTPMRAWEFGIGALACLAPQEWLNRKRRLMPFVGWCGVAMLVGGAIFLTEETLFPGAFASVPAIGTVLVLLSGTAAPREGVGRVLSSSLMSITGRLSYSWYLWHWPVLVIAELSTRELSLLDRILCVSVAFALAAITYILVENPVRYSSRLRGRNLVSLALGATLVTGSAAGAYLAYLSAKRIMDAPAQRMIAEAANDHPGWECMAGFLDKRLTECAFGDSDANAVVVLAGDSHALQWLPAFKEIAVTRGWRLVTLIKSACPMVEAPIFNPRLGRINHECKVWRDAALKRIDELGASAIILSASVGYIKGPGREGGYSQLTQEEWAEGLREILSQISATATQIVVIRDNPNPGINVVKCLSREAWDGSLNAKSCRFDRSAVLDDAVFEAETAVIAQFANATAVDLSDQFCDYQLCDSVRSGIIIYRDSNHLTASYVRQLIPVLKKRIGSQLPLESLATGEGS